MSMSTRLRSFRFAPVASLTSALLFAACATATVSAKGPGPDRCQRSPRPSLTILQRSLSQEQGGWLISYRLRYHGASGMVVTPSEVFAKVESWVSNSRVASHATPRLSSLVISGSDGLTVTGVTDVVTAPEEAQRCRERALIQVWTDDDENNAPPPWPVSTTMPGRAAPPDPRQPILSVAPGGTLRVRVKLEHVHVLFGDYDPLLGLRDLELRLGVATLRDAVPLDREHYLAMPKSGWPEPPEDRRDTRMSVTGPDSLHLEAHVPGNQYYRFPERPVRYGTKMKLTYWYYVAAGSEGECYARVAQYKETATEYKVLSKGACEDDLKTVGKWVKVEWVFRTEPEATTLALDFRISGAEIGEMWVDDVTLEPACASRSGGP